MASPDFYDVLRALDADDRFKDFTLSLFRGYRDDGRRHEVTVGFLGHEVDHETVAQLADFAKRHGLEAQVSHSGVVMRSHASAGQ